MLLEQLTSLFRSIWEAGKVAQDFKDASIVHIYKKKGDKTTCDNHRGISLFCIAGKILVYMCYLGSTYMLMSDLTVALK